MIGGARGAICYIFSTINANSREKRETYFIDGESISQSRMTNLSRSVPPGLSLSQRRGSPSPRRSNHDPAGDTQQDTRGNAGEQNQECLVGVRNSRARGSFFFSLPLRIL